MTGLLWQDSAFRKLISGFIPASLRPMFQSLWAQRVTVLHTENSCSRRPLRTRATRVYQEGFSMFPASVCQVVVVFLWDYTPTVLLCLCTYLHNQAGDVAGLAAASENRTWSKHTVMVHCHVKFSVVSFWASESHGETFCPQEKTHVAKYTSKSD